MSKIVYVETDTTDTYLNFATEYYIARESDVFDRTHCNAVFLFWRTTPTVMLGKYQNVYEEINLDYVGENNINIVRRMSGGGTIYTDLGGWQFTFISEKNPDEISFSEYLEPVLTALKGLGIEAEFNGRNDIMVAGKKVSGNAQYKLGNKTVHHGSLLFDSDIEQMVKATIVSDEKIISKGIKSVRERVTNISQHLPRCISPEEFKSLIVEHILGDGITYTLSQSEKQRISVIAEEKFRDESNIFIQNPKFSIQRSKRFPGGKMDIRLEVKKGVISDCSIFGDFFATVSAEQLREVLIGCEFNREGVSAALVNGGLENAILGITATDIAELIFG